ncbi:MAG: zinc-ribbon domain-containing protein [Clostridia bacterium]|nr:zinc-ribbon domain-containing protein [Clostridia bacterium]
MFCSKCGTEISDEAVICVHCGASVGQPETKPEAPVAEDKVSIGFCILAFFIPLFGVIYWALKYKETPKKAKACGITAIVSWVLNLFLSVIISVVYAVLMTSLM